MRWRVREKEIPTIGGGSINGPSNRGRDGLTFGFELILIKMKYLRLYNVSIHIDFYQNRFINECAKKIKFQSLTVSSFFC